MKSRSQKVSTPFVIIFAILLFAIGGYYFIFQKQNNKSVYSDVPIAETNDDIQSWNLWKPTNGDFTIKLPTNWSVASLDSGAGSEIRIFSSSVSWSQAHDPEIKTDLIIRIALSQSPVTRDKKLNWNSAGDKVTSSTIFLSSDKGAISFNIEYSNNTNKDIVQKIINNLNLEPSNNELENATIIP